MQSLRKIPTLKFSSNSTSNIVDFYAIGAFWANLKICSKGSISLKLVSIHKLRKKTIDIATSYVKKNPNLIQQVLLGLLEMCCEADWWVPSSKYGLPLTAAGDSCRTSRLALTSIARVRPAVFITSISKEIARYNNLGNFTIFTILQFHELFSKYTRVARVYSALISIGQVRPAVFISKKITLLFKNIWLLLKIQLFDLVFRPEGHRAYPQGGLCSWIKKNNSCFVEWYGN